MPMSLVKRLQFPELWKAPVRPPTTHEVPASTIGIVPRHGLVLIAARPFEVSPWVERDTISDDPKTLS